MGSVINLDRIYSIVMDLESRHDFKQKFQELLFDILRRNRDPANAQTWPQINFAATGDVAAKLNCPLGCKVEMSLEPADGTMTSPDLTG
ncbi:hypothetical protein [Ensifer sp.]|uniref:hypothetical protein n=1 Tax=Ensifer sp. TaxID=1872086 RepID=UPI002896C1C7|nr:hypothetical protein [Ensifer sp.]